MPKNKGLSLTTSGDDDPSSDGIDMPVSTSKAATAIAGGSPNNKKPNQPYRRISTDIETATTEDSTGENTHHESDRLLTDDDENNKDKSSSNDTQQQQHQRLRHKDALALGGGDNSCFFMSAWLCLILILGVIILGLNIWRKHEHSLSVKQNNGNTIHKNRIYNDNDDDNDDDDNVTPTSTDDNNNNSENKGSFYFDPNAAVNSFDLLDLARDAMGDGGYASTLVPPVWNPLLDDDDEENSNDHKNRLGYMMQPSTVNGTLAFVSEGDLYWTSWWNTPTTPNLDAFLPAMKLTTTVGNVRDPIINPKYPYWIAYTATYTGRRDVYLIDLRRKTHGQLPAMRLTYWPDSFGVRGLVGWKDDGKTLIIEAYSTTVSLPDVRMYELTLAIETTKPKRRKTVQQNDTTDATILDNNNVDMDNSVLDDPSQTMMIKHPQVLQNNPVPLAQAINGVYHDHEDCWYFTRFQQSSNTARYQGGTAESIWAWCQGHELAVVLTTHQFNGTSKEPSIFTLETQDGKHAHYMFFLSDRGLNADPNDPNEWKATTMNLWAVLLPKKEDLEALGNPEAATPTTPPPIPSFKPTQFIQLTQTACEFEGMSLKEYSLDPVTQNVVLRIGADLYWMSAETIRQKLLHPPPSRELQETNTTKKRNKESTNKQLQRSNDIHDLNVLVYSDFHEHQERIIPVSLTDHLDGADVYETAFGQLSFLMTVRGQVWVAPVAEDKATLDAPYRGAGRNLPLRRYRVVPGSKFGGAVRVLAGRHVPVLMQDDTSARRLAIILATDPKSPTAEHAFYLIETQSDALPSFVSMDDLPDPFVGGDKGGGSTRDGGLGSVRGDSVTVSPCGRRMAWVDTDGRICVMTLPLYKESQEEYGEYTVLPKENERGEPLVGAEAELKWSPGGRFLAVEHNARNQFTIISIADLGEPLMPGSEVQGEDFDPKTAGITLGRIVQATPDRFNSFSPYWGKSNFDQNYYSEAASLAEAFGAEAKTELATTTLYFLTDRDILNEASSPWGTRAPSPHFKKYTIVYGLPLVPQEHEFNAYSGHFSGGGAEELFVDKFLELKSKSKEKRRMSDMPSPAPTEKDTEERFPQDPDIDFGQPDLSFARTAYRLANIPIAMYTSIVSQANDDSSLLLIEQADDGHHLKVALTIDFPSDKIEMNEAPSMISDYGLSTTRGHVYIVFQDPSQSGSTPTVKIVPNTADGFMSLVSDADLEESIVFTERMAISVWPAMEYKQMYADAWRLMRDYFYDPGMTGIDWHLMYERYLPLVGRCAKREELDDVLEYMASEVSALHVFVNGGEYSTPLAHDVEGLFAHIPASLGVDVERSAEWNGYMIRALPELDPDFSLLDRVELYSPLSDKVLRLSGQKGLKVGDVIVAINGESVMQVPDMNMLLRGMRLQSIRLDVLRLASSPSSSENPENIKAEPVIAVPVDPREDLYYPAWEFRTRQQAKKLAEEAGFSVGYIHLKSMSSPEDEDAFARGYFPDYDKDALIVDVRHNRGGNIDWWLLDVLQRKAWMYWDGRAYNASTGGLGWDEQFAFRGHIVILVNERTASDGEGFSRGMSELGLGRLIGTRTWGGGIWLASDNNLVDGGIATAPEDGTYNEKFGSGLGIEQKGLQPDIVCDNNPRTWYDGKDTQLETAIAVLKQWLEEEPVVLPKAPAKRNMAFDSESCAAA